jgi:hypothetical protein
VRAVVIAAVWILILWLVVGVWRLRRKRSRPGPAMSASMEMLFDDSRRAAVEVIVEERTGERDPEDKDGDLPQLQQPGRVRP